MASAGVNPTRAAAEILAVARVLGRPPVVAAQLLGDDTVLGRARLARRLRDVLSRPHPKGRPPTSAAGVRWLAAADIAAEVEVRARSEALAGPWTPKALRAVHGMLTGEVERIEREILDGAQTVDAELHRDELLATARAALALATGAYRATANRSA